MHTRASDGLPTVQRLLDFVARRRALDVIAITDHDVLDASLWAYEHRERYPFDIVPGVEVTTCEGHVLALWVTRTIPRGMNIAETAAAIHEQGGVAVLAHPGEVLIAGKTVFRHLKDPFGLLQTGIDAIELYNAGSLTPGSNLLAGRIVAPIAHAIAVTGSSDAHTLNAVGSGKTRFAGRRAEDLRRALLERQTQVERGEAWSLIDYLKLSPGTIRGRLNGFLARSLP